MAAYSTTADDFIPKTPKRAAHESGVKPPHSKTTDSWLRRSDDGHIIGCRP